MIAGKSKRSEVWGIKSKDGRLLTERTDVLEHRIYGRTI